jgi:TrmH family RNA methyltransferase
MVSKSKANFIISLQKKKEREKEGLFVIEGDKIVKEFLTAKVRIRTLVAKPEFINSLSKELWEYIGETESASFDELRKIRGSEPAQCTCSCDNAKFTMEAMTFRG